LTRIRLGERALHLIGFTTMTVCASHLAFGDLEFDALPTHTLTDHVGHVSGLIIGYMVKLKDDGVRFAAVNARVKAKKSPDVVPVAVYVMVEM
jgi:hypothetical protein